MNQQQRKEARELKRKGLKLKTIAKNLKVPIADLRRMFPEQPVPVGDEPTAGERVYQWVMGKRGRE